MADQSQRFSFVSRGSMPADTFGVVRFKGFEGLSTVYQFDIELISKDPAVDMTEVVQNPARFTILRKEGDIPFYGIPVSFEQMHEVDGTVFYRVVLAPKLWWLSQTHHNQVFLQQTVPEILEAVLKDGGLTENDFEFRLEEDYRKWEYVCQYRESHLDFASRWMEREGMYYFFEQGAAGEKLIITDSNLSHLPMPQGKTMYYSPPSALDSLAREEVIKDFCCRQNTLPSSVRLKDYNYEKPSLAMEGLANVYEEGRGEVYLYGDHFLTPEEGQHLAKIRAQEINCWERTYHGESTVPFLRPGFTLELVDHYRQDFNLDYLTVEATHQGSQAAYMLAGLSKELAEGEKQPYYVNTFTALPARVQFRPRRKTKKARFYGTMHARIDAAGSGKYAEVDEQGRYKVILPFDRSGRFGGKASSWIRMMQPYAGPNQGMHFPLHKGTEVLLTFIDGDPDRPIIAGAVPNPETSSPVNNLNQTKSVLQTGRSPENMSAGAAAADYSRDSGETDEAGNELPVDPNNRIEFDDTDNGESILIKSRQAWSRHGKNNNDPGNDDVNTTNTDNKPEQEKTANTTGIKFYTDGKLSFQSNTGHERRIVGHSIDTARDGSLYTDSEGNDHDMAYLLTTMENFAPQNVHGYDEKEELDSSGTAPDGFPENYEVFPDPFGDVPEKFKEDYFDRAGNDDLSNVDYLKESIDDLLETYDEDKGEAEKDEDQSEKADLIEDLWKQYVRYWIRRNKPDTKSDEEMGIDKPSFLKDYPIIHDHLREGEDVSFDDSQLKTDLDDSINQRWEDWRKQRREDWKKWQPHLEKGHITVSHRDTFNLQEGNIYDFGGYWNYNLGNCYVEEHLDQHAQLNDTHEWDLLGAAGPYWYEEEAPWRTVKSGEKGGSKNQLKNNAHASSDGWKNIWVEKHFGDAYEYTEGSTISVTKGSSQEIQIGGRHVEEKYNGSGNKTLYSVSEKGKTEETKWCPHTGDMLSYSTSKKAPNAVHSYEYNRAATASATISLAAGTSFEFKLATNLDATVYAAMNTDLSAYAAGKIDLSAHAGLSLALEAYAGISLDMAAHGAIKMVAEAAAGATVEVKTGTVAALEATSRPAKIELEGEAGIFKLSSGQSSKIEKSSPLSLAFRTLFVDV